MSSLTGNPTSKPKYAELIKFVGLPESIADSITALLQPSITTSEVLQKLKSVPLLHGNQLPAVPAIYFVYQRERLLHIGRTMNLHQRWIIHHRRREFAKLEGVRIAWFDCDEKSLAELEKSQIELLEPEINSEAVKSEHSALIQFRLSGAELEALIAHQAEGESLNLAAQRLMKERLRQLGWGLEP